MHSLVAKDIAPFYSKVSSGWANVQTDLFLPWVHILFGGSIVRKVSGAYPGVVSLILAGSYTFMEIDHEIISTAILPHVLLIQEELSSVKSLILAQSYG